MEQNKVLCLLCSKDDFLHQIVFETPSFYVILPRKKIGNGYFLVFPKRHINDFNLSSDEFKDFSLCMEKIKKLFTDYHKSVDYNLFCNIGYSAGQHIEHLHFHVFSRSENEEYNPLNKLNKEGLSRSGQLSEEEIITLVGKYKNS